MIDRLLAPFRDFSNSAAAGGVLLIVAAIAAIIWANSPAAGLYEALLEVEVSLGVGDLSLAESFHTWVNDGLMAVFFLVVGLEIKRELLVGELSRARRAVLPVAAAAGGALLPAVIFLLIAGPTTGGWGIPIATDIAFALGVLALLGSRVPLGLRVFLAALAIADDLFAVAVIAIFYATDLSPIALIVVCAVVATLLLANKLGVRHPAVYAAMGVVLWVAVFQSGIHATVAGVLLAATIPATTVLDSHSFIIRARRLIDDLAQRNHNDPSIGAQHAALWDLERLTEQSQAPMLRIEHALEPWVAFVILPLFALANAGVSIAGNATELLADPVVIGIAVGLIVGKQAGITGTAWILVRTGVARLPDGVRMRHIHGAACLGGIGFTMSLLIAELAFGGMPELANAKIAVFSASGVAALLGLGVLLGVLPGAEAGVGHSRFEHDKHGKPAPPSTR